MFDATNVIPRAASVAVPLNVSIDVEGGIAGAVLCLVLSGKLTTAYRHHSRPTHQETLAWYVCFPTVEELLDWLGIRPAVIKVNNIGRS
jgi:hypothetical protein